MIIYKVINKITGKEYIGQTVGDLEIRKQNHIQDALNKKDGMYFHRAIRKYGSDSFDWKIIAECDTIEELNKLEIYYIGYYDTYNNGYNLTLGGRGKAGYKYSTETLKKMSLSHIGKKASVESKLKMSLARLGENNPNYDKYGGDNLCAKAIMIGDRYFNALIEAGDFLGITPSALIYRILHKTKWLDYKYVNSAKAGTK